MYSYLHLFTYIRTKCKDQIITPTIMKTPGVFEGAQYNFHELLKQTLRNKVAICTKLADAFIYIYIYIYIYI